ncbi:hypothetical protein QQS21_008623 [Conoideocrella luteorostrata]|uniref:Aminoglycoside phosphotransferase domain-containing protein n=1 Tax=Conoideocrella luteorostrata TaxID=1105319 RepID=A0AAJ0CIU5_9HYPO|nr:hypothetical protein QQS21_008623 [Conoideocrella luteorostrata]
MEQLSPAVLHTRKLTLAGLAPPGSFGCEYLVINERAKEGIIAPHNLEVTPCEEWDVRSIQCHLLIFDPTDVEVLYSDGRSICDITPQHVYVHAKGYFYKPYWSPHDAIEEVKQYFKIAASGKCEQLRTSRLSSIVASVHGHAKGLLCDWIEMRGAGVLTHMLTPDTPIALREKWATQIKSTVTELHGVGVVWGDAKPDNVLIDINNDAIVIDLEGGTTRGWVDHDVGSFLEGDLQGLGRLINCVLNDELPLGRSQMSDETSSSNESS